MEGVEVKDGVGRRRGIGGGDGVLVQRLLSMTGLNILSWNIRGLRIRVKECIKELCKQWRVDILILRETKLGRIGRKG